MTVCSPVAALARRGSNWLSAGLLAVVALCCAGDAAAEPFVGRGEATVAELGAKGTLEQARKRAVRRARQEALSAALEQLQSPVDRAARKAVTASEGWTGAYRILEQSMDSGRVQVELEVEIDLQRLSKRLMPRPAVTAQPRFGPVVWSESAASSGAFECVELERLRQELLALGAVRAEGGEPLRVTARCERLGPVPHTLVHAARVRLQAQADGREVASAAASGLGPSESSALTQALQQAAEALAASVGRHRAGQVQVTIRSPLPAARIRRLERAIRESVLGVAQTEVVGVDEQGAVLLRVVGELRAEALSRRLQALSLPGFSLTIVQVEGPDALTIALQ